MGIIVVIHNDSGQPMTFRVSGDNDWHCLNHGEKKIWNLHLSNRKILIKARDRGGEMLGFANKAVTTGENHYYFRNGRFSER